MAALDLAIRITAIDAASRALGGVRSGLDSLAASAGRQGAVLSATVTGPIVAGFLSAAGAVAGYEQNLNVLAATAGLTAEQQAEAGRAAKQLGADVTIPGASAADAAAVMVELGRAGLSFTNILAAAPGVLRLAAAGQLEHARAAQIAANALNQFNLSGDRATAVADIFAGAANASSADVQDIALTFQQAGSVFSEFQGKVVGQEAALRQLAVATALLANAGIRGSDAGTSLKQSLLQLAAPSGKQRDAAQALYFAYLNAGSKIGDLDKALSGTAKQRGEALNSLAKQSGTSLNKVGTVAYDAAGKMRPFAEILDIVRVATAHMTDEMRQGFVAEVFGADAVKVILPLLSVTKEEYDKVSEAVNKTGAATDLAGARMKGLAGILEILRNTWETLVLTTIEPFLPLMTGVGEAVNGLLGRIGELDPDVRNAAAAFLVVAASAGPFLLIVSGLAAAAAFLLTPFGALVAILAGLAAAVAGAGGPIAAFRPAIENVARAFAAFARGSAGFEIVTEEIRRGFGIDITPFLDALRSIGAWIVGVGIPAFLAFVGAVSNFVIPAIGRFAAWVTAVALPAARQFGAWFSTVAIPALLTFAGFIAGVVMPAARQLSAWFSAVAIPVLLAFANFVVGVVIPAVTSFAAAFVGQALAAAQSFGAWLQSDGVPLLASLWGLLQAVGQVAVDLVGPAFVVLAARAGDILKEVRPLLDSFKELFIAVDPLAKAIGFLFAGVVALVPAMIRTLTGFIQVLTGTFQGVRAVIEGIAVAFAALARGDTKGALDAITASFNNLGKAGDTVARGFGTVGSAADKALTDTGIKGILESPLPLFPKPTATGVTERPPLPATPGATERPPVLAGPPAPTPEELERQQRHSDAMDELTRAHQRLAVSANRVSDILDGIPTDWGSRFAAAMEAR